MNEIFRPQPTEEEWKVWCAKNRDMWATKFWLKKWYKGNIDQPDFKMHADDSPD